VGRKMRRKLKDLVARRFMLLATFFSSILVFLIVAGLLQRSSLILLTKPISELILSSTWRPLAGEFGFYPFIIGTFWVTAIAMALAIPICVLATVYLVEYAPSRLRELMKPLVDLLAGIPSVVFGVCGVLAIVPLVKKLALLFGIATTGYSVFAGGIVLAVMVFPIIISVSHEVLRSVPNEVREASLSLGATKWQTVKHVVMRIAFPGVVAAVILGFSRALGETMAVLMVVGNVPKVPLSVFDPGYPLPALIANSYGEMMSIPLYDSALLLAALMLLVVVFVSNVLARMMVSRIGVMMHR